MKEIKIIDLHFLNGEYAIASFLIESSNGLILIETGPETTFRSLKNGIESFGYQVEDVKHVILTHIHFDHAGAAWKFARNGAKIYVHPIGLPHLANPERLWNSAAQIYKDDMDRLWGKMESIPENQLIAVNDGDEITIGGEHFKFHYMPGHAIHHNVIQYGNAVFTGDVGGVKIGGGPVVPPCPPPDINLGLWKQSIQKLQNLNAKELYLTHFGKHESTKSYFDDLKKTLDDWANWIKPYYDAQVSAEEITPKFMEYTKNQLIKQGLNEAQIQIYEYANPTWMSVTGLLRYWKLKEQGRI
ncbi:MAG: MBL fold metallo-hydrolase [Flavobacteriaceae bacterium]|jgi:glyoxylase-like metal-dependent hydrolase (beta-lactamase superfamily II)|nr:MBL fold metallo-hydrolase [Flavobacteriaceae bacterium]